MAARVTMFPLSAEATMTPAGDASRKRFLVGHKGNDMTSSTKLNWRTSGLPLAYRKSGRQRRDALTGRTHTAAAFHIGETRPPPRGTLDDAAGSPSRLGATTSRWAALADGWTY